MEKISIIVPVYKAEKQLNKCISSIVNQSYKNLEIILVDDGSPDNCPQICDAWSQKDERIKVLHIENKGVANARNTALKIITGNYVAFVDSDDFIEPDMYVTLYNLISKVDSDIAICDFFENEVENNYPTKIDNKTALEKIAMGDFLFGVLWNKLYKKEVIKQIEMPLLACCEDLVFNYYVFKNCKNIAITNNKKYHYVHNDASITSGKFNIGAFDAVKSKKIILSDAKNTPLEKYAVRGLISSCFIVLSGAIKAKNYQAESENLRKTIIFYRKTIIKSNMYSKRDKFKTILLFLSKRLFVIFVNVKHL